MRLLGKIAVAGIGVGIVSLSLAWTIAGRDLRHVLHDGPFARYAACDTGKAVIGGSERRLPWTGDDSIEIALSIPLRLVAGSGSDVVLRGDPTTIAHLQLSGGHLRADCRPLRDAQTVTVELPARALRTVRLAGSVKA